MSQRPFRGKTSYFSVEPNITLVQGGIATNILPETCEVDIDIRFPPGVQSTLIIKEIEDIIQGQNVKMQIKSQIEGFRADKETQLAQNLKNAVENITKTEAKFLRKSGTNFMAIIGNRLQIPVISYGPGDPNLDHTPHEHIEVNQFKQSIDVLENFILLMNKG